MLQLKDLMQRDVVAVSPDLTLRELIEVLSEQEVSGAPVVASSKVVGVVSTTDIFDFREETLDATPRPGALADNPEGGPLRRAGSEFFSESWDASDVEALDWMRTTRARTWDLLDEYTVSDIMTREVLSQPSKTTVKKAARYMLDAGVHRLLVIDGGELQGIVTTTDIVRAVAEGKLKG